MLHCYEIASKAQSEIIPLLLNKENIGGVVIAICVDLSRPSSVIEEVNEWLSVARKEVNIALH